MNNTSVTPIMQQTSLFGEPAGVPASGIYNTLQCLTETKQDDTYLVSPNSLEQWQRDLFYSYQDKTSVGVTINLHPSGEVSMGYFSPKRETGKEINRQSGRRITCGVTPSMKKKIRRVGRNCKTRLQTFLTLTFDPKQSKLNADGTIDQDWAQGEIRRLLNTLSKKFARLSEKTGKNHFFQYICVAEIQPSNGNIHYHLITNKYFNIPYLVKIWGQASNSVDIRKIKGSAAKCVNYLVKYVTKENKETSFSNDIAGNRYSISQGLREESKPKTIRAFGSRCRCAVQTFIDENNEKILHGRGYLCDWGFYLPPHSRKSGEIKHIEQVEFLFGVASALASAGDDTLLLHLFAEGYGE